MDELSTILHWLKLIDVTFLIKDSTSRTIHISKSMYKLSCCVNSENLCLWMNSLSEYDFFCRNSFASEESWSRSDLKLSAIRFASWRSNWHFSKSPSVLKFKVDNLFVRFQRNFPKIFSENWNTLLLFYHFHKSLITHQLSINEDFVTIKFTKQTNCENKKMT